MLGAFELAAAFGIEKIVGHPLDIVLVGEGLSPCQHHVRRLLHHQARQRDGAAIEVGCEGVSRESRVSSTVSQRSTRYIKKGQAV